MDAPAWAEGEGAGPSYTYLGVSYEKTDVKNGIDPSSDARFNNGELEGYNIDASLGILNWLHVAGQYFDGDCVPCGTNANGNSFDQGFSTYKVGLGVNFGLDRIGLNDRTGFRINN